MYYSSIIIIGSITFNTTSIIIIITLDYYNQYYYYIYVIDRWSFLGPGIPSGHAGAAGRGHPRTHPGWNAEMATFVAQEIFGPQLSWVWVNTYRYIF